MVSFFKTKSNSWYAVQTLAPLSIENTNKLVWLFDEAEALTDTELLGHFVGPRREMITPWSTNAVEITQNMGIEGILRIEEFYKETDTTEFDPMLQRKYDKIDQNIFRLI